MPKPPAIVRPLSASAAERFAAGEIRRYVYLRTGELLTVRPENDFQGGPAILVASEASPLVESLARQSRIRLPELAPGQYRLKSIEISNQPITLVTGGDDIGTLYGAYRLAERLGVRFYLHGDVVPDERVPLRLPVLDETGKPLFALRGIQPFHDFPEGPDWWNRDEYLAVIGQLPKLRMNFIGLHTYPEGGPNAEPTVWIGPPSEVGAGEKVKASYPSSYANTRRGNWGYAPKQTGDFSCGANLLFDRDDFGPEVMNGAMPEPATPAACNQVFERTGALLRDAFTEAHRLGVKTCVGTETPLKVPRQLAERLQAEGRNPQDHNVVEQLYEGIFRRAAQAYPLDYYWFWTPEGWTWEGRKAEDITATTNDFAAAIEAWRALKPGFDLATCGWVLGPQEDRTLFDRVLPKSVAVSCINRQVGHTPVDRGFAEVEGRPKWAIPWLEDDGGLTAPELWAARMRRDAFDARRYGCDGLMGIHWRTRVLGPAVSALAEAAWSQSGWSASWQPDPPSATNFPPIADFYDDWAEHQFGPEAGAAAAAIFTRIDGRLPRPAQWVDGPGGIRPDARSWEEVRKQYAFVDDFGSLAPRVRGPGNRERFEYWLNTFQYLREMGQVNCTWARLTNALFVARSATNAAEGARLATEQALPVRRELVSQVDRLYGFLLATVSNTGELGTIANWEEHNFPELIGMTGRELAELLGHELPEDAQLSKVYRGPPRIFVPAVRTSFHRGQPLSLRVLVLSAQSPEGVVLHWRRLGAVRYSELPLSHVARGVYRADFPSVASRADDVEYYLELKLVIGKPVVWPATAPERGQTLVAMEP